MKRVSPDNIIVCDNVYIPAKKSLYVRCEKVRTLELTVMEVHFFIFLSMRGKNLNFITQPYFYIFLRISYRESGQIYNCSLNSNMTAI